MTVFTGVRSRSFSPTVHRRAGVVTLILVAWMILPTVDAQPVPGPRSASERDPAAVSRTSDAGVESDDAGPSADVKYWIFFAPRSAETSAVDDHPERTAASSVHARQRRNRRGSDAASIDALTRPVSGSHMGRLQDLQIEPIVVSRWLNAVSATLSADERDSLASAPWVDRIQRIGRVQPAGSSAPSGAPAQPVASPVLTRAAESTRSPLDRANRRAPLLPASSSPLRDSGQRTRIPTGADSAFFGASYGQLRQINALAPLRRGIDGRGVRLGFLDTGYRTLQHPAFDALRQEGRLRGLRDFTERPQTNNHGGGVVSTAAGYAPGILVGPAHGADIWAAATEYTPSETNIEEDHFVAGLEWLERQGVDVVNVSLGYTTFDEGERSYTVEDLDGDTGVTTRAVDAAARLGVTVVVSAGNSGCNSPENCWYYVSTPADADSAVTVGAVLPDSSVAPFSSRGPTADGRTKPDVMAPGDGIVAAWETSAYAQVNGTSFASPLVSGIVAQMMQQNPDLQPMQVRRILRQTASQPSTPDDRMGWGIVNADAAVRAAERQARSRPPSDLQVSGPAPTPASDRVTFSLRAPETSDSVDIALFDVLGRRVQTVQRSLQPGPNTVQISVSDLAPGVYPYRLRSGSIVTTGKIVVVR